MTKTARRRASRTSPDARTTSRRLARRQALIALLLAQRSRPIGVDQLAERLGVSERTVDRDLEAIRAAQLPLRGRGGKGGGVWLDVTRTRPAIRLDDEAVMGVLLALDALDAELPAELVQTRSLLQAQLNDPRLF